jgi:hypothetical protein
MNRLLFLVPLGALLAAPNPATAQSAFDGTWKISLKDVDWSKKPDVFLLDKGMYSCKTCTPPYTVKADGSDQAVTGHPYFDSIAIKVVSDHEIQETDKKGGKVVGNSTTTISDDGKTAMWSFTDSSNTNGGPPVTGKGESVLVLKGPAGSHAVSGSWRISKMENMSDNGLVFSYKVTGDMITMNAKSGQSYTAKLDGTDAPMNGDPGVTTVSVKKLSSHVLQETDKRDGKAISVMTLTVSPDGRTARAIAQDKLQNRTTVFDIVKQ